MASSPAVRRCASPRAPSAPRTWRSVSTRPARTRRRCSRIVGQVESEHRGHEAFQEIDQVATIGGLAKWAVEPEDADAVAPAVAEAIRQALGGRPGPVLISLREELLDEPAPDDSKVDTGRAGPARATDDDIRAVIELLASAERPVILAGGGVLRARTSTELLRFAELLQVPIVAAWRRADVVSNDHPLYLGMAGLGAASSVRERFAAADAMLVIGCRLNEPTSYEDTIPAASTRWAHVDIEPGRGGADRHAAERTVTADARAFLRAANERLLGKAVLDAALVGKRQAHNTDRPCRLGGHLDRRWRRGRLVRSRCPPRSRRHDAAPGAA